MKKSKILLCLGLGALLSSTALMASPKQNELELKGLNVEKVVGVKKASESPTRTLSVHFKLDKGSYEGLYAYMWGTTSSTNAMIEFTSINSFEDGYGITLNVDLTKAEYGFNEETSFGIILKYGSGWDSKIGGDRMFTVPETLIMGYTMYILITMMQVYSVKMMILEKIIFNGWQETILRNYQQKLNYIILLKKQVKIILSLI